MNGRTDCTGTDTDSAGTGTDQADNTTDGTGTNTNVTGTNTNGTGTGTFTLADSNDCTGPECSQLAALLSRSICGGVGETTLTENC